MPGIHLYTSCYVEHLTDHLGNLFETSPLSPFERETILVQGRGMERYIKAYLARRSGGIAALEFPFPNHFLMSLIDRDPSTPFPFDSHRLTWKIMDTIPRLLQREEFKPIQNYLESQNDDSALYLLSKQTADLFDRYTVHRTEMMKEWSFSDPSTLESRFPELTREMLWQPILWRELYPPESSDHPVKITESLIDSASGVSKQSYPRRIFLFGLSSLPRLHIRILGALSQKIDIHYYLFSPVSHPEKQNGRFGGKEKSDPKAEGSDLYRFMGTTGREFYESIIQHSKADSFDLHEWFLDDSMDPVKPSSLLEHLQTSIRKNEKLSSPVKIRKDEPSIEIHSVHSRFREIQELKNTILRTLSDDPSIALDQIIVMAPDIGAYGALIESVFNEGDSSSFLPYSIADRLSTDEEEIFEIIDFCFELIHREVTVSEVFSLLDYRTIQNHFSLSIEEIRSLERFVSMARIRWGIDGDHRKNMGYVAEEQNSWIFGIRRILLGAITGFSPRFPFRDIYPLDLAEGDLLELFGRFLDFLDFLFATIESLKTPVELNRWVEVLGKIPEQLLEEKTDAFIRATQTIHKIESLDPDHSISIAPGPKTIQRILKDLRNTGRFGQSFLTGKITFCELTPMRSIPADMIVLLGMNESEFPVKEIKPAFDLMARSRKPAERSRTLDDRQLFLETILSARKKLVLSYTGKGIRDNRIYHPSTLLRELMDALQSLTGKKIEDFPFYYQHKLHPFSPDYFHRTSGLPPSFSDRDLAGARALVDASPETEKPFADFSNLDLTGMTRMSREQTMEVHFQDLIRTLKNPAGAHLKKQYGFTAEKEFESDDDEEPVAIDPLTSWSIQTELIYQNFRNDSSESPISSREHIQTDPVFRFYSGQGQLPWSVPGQVLFKREKERSSQLLNLVDTFLKPAATPGAIEYVTLPFRLHLDQDHFFGTVEFLQDRSPVASNKNDRVLFIRSSRFSGKHLFEPWISSLVLRLLYKKQELAFLPRFFFIAKSESSSSKEDFVVLELLEPESDPEKEIQFFLNLYSALESAPVLYFPDTGFSIMDYKKDDPDFRRLQIQRLTEKWLEVLFDAAYSPPGDLSDPSTMLLFRGNTPDGNPEISERVYENCRTVFNRIRYQKISLESILSGAPR